MTLDQEKVKNIITTCKFTPDLKQRMILILPGLDKYLLDGLGREVAIENNLLIAESLVKRWENFARLLEGLKKADIAISGDFIRQFKEMSDPLLNQDDKLYFLNLVLDVRALASAGKVRFTLGQFNDILEYEILLFWFLPKEEVLFFIQNQLLFLESKVNLLEHIKAIIWDNDWDYAKDFEKIFSESLLQNKEKLSAKTIGEWIEEYFNSTPSVASRSNFLQIAQFMVKNPLIQKLSNEQKKTLSEILKLYAWILQPEIDEDEVLSYKEEVRQKQAEEADKAFLEAVKSAGVAQSQIPVAPAPKNTPVLRPIEEIRSQLVQASPGQPSRSLPNLNSGLPQNNLMPKGSSLGQKTQAEIDRKLQELEKRIKE